MKIIVEMTREDFIAYNTFTCGRINNAASWHNAKYGMLYNFCLWLGIVLFFTFAFQLEAFDGPFHWPSGIAVGIVFFALYAFNLYFAKKYQNKIFPRENGVVLGEKEIELSEMGVSEVGRLSRSEFNWEGFREVAEYQGHVYLYLEPTMAVIIPASTFKEESDLKQFLEAVEKLSKLKVSPQAKF